MEQLSKQKGAQTRHGEDVRETLRWLDDATSRQSNPIALQGAEDHFERWVDVEKFAVPRSLFSEEDGLDAEPEPEIDVIPDEDLSKLVLSEVTRKTPASSVASAGSHSPSPNSMRSERSSLDAISPPTSPMKVVSSPVKQDVAPADQSSSSSATVPARVQPLFNYILWRIHQEENPVAALESFIFLCNDQSKVNYAKGFEIKTKRLEQLRDAIGREDRDFKNRQMVLQREDQQDGPGAQQHRHDSHSINVERTSPPTAPAAMLADIEPAQNVIDPDAFGRGDAALRPQSVDPRPPPRSPRPHNASMQGGRGGQNLPFAPRGTPRGNFRGGPRGRGNFGGPGRGGLPPQNRVDGAVPQGQIDPNSFVRPRGGYTGRGGRKLWVPT